MRLANPAAALLGEKDARLLLELYRRAEPLSGRGIAANAGVPVTSAQRILARYADAGLVTVTTSAHASTYELNRKHVLYDAIFELLAAPAKLKETIGSIVQRWAGSAVTAAVFGSSARGDDSSDSDLDILVVTPVDFADDRIDGLRRELEDTVGLATGRTVQVFNVDQQQFSKMVRSHDSLIDSLERDADTVIGTDVRTLIGSAS